MAGTAGPRIDLERIQLADGDCVLVCTNGLTDTVDESRIGEVLASGRSPDEQSRMLVELAWRRAETTTPRRLSRSYRIPA